MNDRIAPEDMSADDRRWAEAARRRTVDEPLDLDDEVHLYRHHLRDPGLAVERRLREEMEDIADEDRDDGEFVATVLDRHFSDARTGRSPLGRTWIGLAAVAATAAALLLGLVLVDHGATESAESPVARRSAPDVKPSEVVTPPVPEGAWRVVVPAGATPVRHTWTDREIRARGERTCVTREDAEGCLDPGGALRRREAGLELLYGRIEFRTAGHRVELKVADTLVVAQTVRLVATIDREGNGRIEVLEGDVTAEAETVSVPVVRSQGEAATEDPRGRSIPPPPIDDLLRAARSLRQAGDHHGAARVLEDAIRHHPRNSKARTALATLGQVYLGPLRKPARALRAFDRYLEQSGGALREEVEYGRIRALRAMGRERDAERARASFLTAHPRSSYRAALEGDQNR